MVGKKLEPRYSAILPILNRGCSIPTSVPLAISPEITFRKIRGDDLAIITEKDNDASSFIKGGTYTLTIDPFIHDENIDITSNKIISALFSLNILGNGLPLSIEKMYVLRNMRKTTLHETRNINGHRHPSADKFEISNLSSLSDAPDLFSAVCNALQKHPPLRITISRFNSAMGRKALDDRLIDLCISLESIFQAQTEISFQFALYNSILSEDDESKRFNIFKILKELYTQRSNIVHGNKDLNSTWINEKWDDLVRIAKASILRKVEFLSENDHGEWKQKLHSLALGVKNHDPDGE